MSTASMSSKLLAAACTAASVLAVIACDSGPAPDMSTARTVFRDKCAVCHGDTGKGDGPGAASLTPKPASFSDGGWQGKISDDSIRKAIVGGGPAVGKSPLMPPNPDLEHKPRVVAGLVKMVRSFK